MTLLTRKQAAEYLGLKPQTLAVWAMKTPERLPMYKNGRRCGYKLKDVKRAKKWVRA